MSDYYRESTLSDSFMYGMLNNNQELTRRLGVAFQKGTILTEKHIQEQLLQIKRTQLSPLVDNVLKSFENGEILLVYSPEFKILQAIPFLIIKVGGRNKAVIFVNNYGTFGKAAMVKGGDSFSIPMKDLYVLMESAFIGYNYYEYPLKLERILGLMRFTSSVYTSMFIRIFNKEYALSMDQDLYNRVSYCISRFYLEKVWESKNDAIINSYSLSNTQNGNKSDLDLLAIEYADAKIVTISDLIKFLKTLSPRLEDLNMRYFTECYINTYRAQALFGIDVLPYFLFSIIAALLGSYIVNQPIIYDILKRTKGVNNFYIELTKLI